MSIEQYLNDKRVLVVDDMAHLRTELSRILTSMGFKNITEKEDGQLAYFEANEKLQEGKPYDFVFSDINMPNLNGLQLLKKLRTIDAYKKIPIFLISTENEKAIIVKAIMDGASDYIIKPYEANTVVSKIYTYLSKTIK